MMFEPLIPLLMVALIGLLVGCLALSWWNIRTATRSRGWLSHYDRVLGWLLILAVCASGLLIAFVLFR